MNAVAVADVPRGTDDTFGGLVRAGETPEDALHRLEKTKGYAKAIGTDEGQRLLAAAHAQSKNGIRIAVKNTAGPALEAASAAVAEQIPAGLRIVQVPIASIDVGTNVRVNVAELDELASSIQEHGVLQPIKVRPAGDRYTVVWGQRRFLASQMVGLATIPAIADDVDRDAPTLAIEQLVENLHRADLAPLDRARAMRAVVDAGMSQADLARELAIAPSTVANDLSLLDAPASIQKAIAEGQLTPSHAKALKGLAPKTQQELARDAIANGYSAHRLEEQVQRQKEYDEREAAARQKTEEQTRKNLERLETSIVELAGKKQPGLDTEIVVDRDRWGDKDAEAKALAERLRKAGFTNVRVWARGDTLETRPKGCGCTAWKARLHSSYSYASGNYETKLSVTKACTVAAHRKAADQASHAAEQAKYALQGKVQAHVKATAFAVAIPPTSADTPPLIGLPRILAEGVLWDFIGYRMPEWSVEHGGSRQKPWATLHALSDEQLAIELAKEVGGDFRDKNGYHIDWPALAAELGVDGSQADG